MKLDDLLKGSEPVISEWLAHQNLLHECDCGYQVYDPDEVSAAVQHRWGDRRCREINLWACDLSNRFGWLFIESAKPQYGIYHCQHCAGSEWSLMMDMMKMAEAADAKRPKAAKLKRAARTRRGKYRVYIDESYTNEFPRKAGGSLALAAFLLAENDAKKLEPEWQRIVAAAYRGQSPKEVKYSKLVKHPGLLERVGHGVNELLAALPSSAVILLYVPSEGLIQEEVRVVRALAHYAKSTPTKSELQEASSPEKVEAAVRGAVSRMAQTIAAAVANFLGSRNLRAEIRFDPRSKKLDEELHADLTRFLPLIPINTPLIAHQDAVVMPWPSARMPRLGRRVKIDFSASSHKCAGLQIADFLAGDIRTFFSEMPELLTDGTVAQPLVNQRVLFPEAFRRSPLSEETKRKLAAYRGKSFLPGYRTKLVHNLVSCFAKNGQMRNVDLAEGVAYDIMD